MSIDAFSHVAWLPVIVGAVIYYALGGLWYSPQVFLKPYLRSMGQTAIVRNMTTFVVPAIGVLVMSIATGALAVATATTTLSAGIILGATVGIGYAGAVTFLDAFLGVPKPDPKTYFAVNGAYHLIGLIIVGALVGAWH